MELPLLFWFLVITGAVALLFALGGMAVMWFNVLLDELNELRRRKDG